MSRTHLTRGFSRTWSPFVAACLTLTCGGPAALAQDAPPPPPDRTPASEPTSAAAGSQTPQPPAQPVNADEMLVDNLVMELLQLRGEVAQMRADRAAEQLKVAAMERELAELKQFIADNRQYGDDFAQYQEIKRITEAAEKRRAAEESRQRRLDEMRRRREAREQGAAEQAAANAERDRVEKYRDAGFNPLGLDVYLGRTGFFYGTSLESGSRVEYEPIIGYFLEPIERESIDFSSMTISGTVVNASEEVRNIGIAVAFFDNRGNQVGSETILINNARPNVPYPFTSTIAMALNGPFASSSAWVLYSDKVQ